MHPFTLKILLCCRCARGRCCHSWRWCCCGW